MKGREPECLSPPERLACDELERRLVEVIDPHLASNHTTVLVDVSVPLSGAIVGEVRRRFVERGWVDLEVAEWLGTAYQVVLRRVLPAASGLLESRYLAM